MAKLLLTIYTELSNIFNDYYTNIVNYTSGTSPTLSETLPSGTNCDIIIDTIIKQIKNHPSIKCINSNKPVTEDEVLKLLKKLNAKKAIGIDGIPPLILKLSANILAKPLTLIINQSILDDSFPTLAKIAAILPLFKKDDRSSKKNYRPVSILSALSKIFGKILQKQIVSF